MKKRLLYVGVLLSTLLVNSQQQQDSTKVENLNEVVLTDSRFELKRENSGKTVIRINALELERNRGVSVATLINSKSGIEINGSRSNGGQNLSYFVRGGTNRQVLVMIDGIQISDPTQLANDYDLRLLDINQIESIEIIKGAASTLYGNSAATAVINITTKNASKEPISATFSTSLGTNHSSNNTNTRIADFNNSIAFSGTMKKFTYQAVFGHQFLDGLSAVSSGTERDAFSRTNATAKLGYQVTKDFVITSYINHDRFTADFDNSFPLEDAEFRSTTKQYRIGVAPKFTYKNGSLGINSSFSKIDRTISSNFPTKYSGKSIILDAFNKYNFNNTFYTIIGINYINTETEFSKNSTANSVDPYVNVVWVSDFGLNLNIGTRLNNHSVYGSNFSYNLNPSYVFKFDKNYIKFLTSYSTSFIAPNLSQLYGPFGPNPNLEPETNTTIEAGLELKITDRLRISTVYFNREEENFIDYAIIDFDTFEGQYQNIDTDFMVHGLEVELSSKLTNFLSIHANYTFTERKDIVAVRIPKHKINASINYNFSKKNYVGLKFQNVGKRLDLDFSSFPSENVVLRSFSIVDLHFGHQLIAKKLWFSASVNNIFNNDYTEILGFTTRGRNYRIGMRLGL